MVLSLVFFFSSRRRHTRFDCDWSSDVCSSDLRIAHCLLADLCASFQEAVCDALTLRAVRAARHARLPALVICGGVAADSRLREEGGERWAGQGILLLLPPRRAGAHNSALNSLPRAHPPGP